MISVIVLNSKNDELSHVPNSKNDDLSHVPNSKNDDLSNILNPEDGDLSHVLNPEDGVKLRRPRAVYKVIDSTSPWLGKKMVRKKKPGIYKPGLRK